MSYLHGVYRLSNLRPWAITWFVFVHGLGAAGVWYAYAAPAVSLPGGVASAFSLYTALFACAYFMACHLAISCGVHRLYAHNAYEASLFLQYVSMVLFSAAIQSNAYWWIAVHRLHHARTDTPEDRHSPVVYGGFHSHIGCFLTKSGIVDPPAKYFAGLEKHAPIMWQRRNHWWLALVGGIGVPVAVCAAWGDPLGGLLIGVCLRLVCQYHLTWVINSVSHTFGVRVERGASATNMPWPLSWVLGILTSGEIYHANHHKWSNDWRLGRKWYDIDPGKWVIWLSVQLRLARLRTGRA